MADEELAKLLRGLALSNFYFLQSRVYEKSNPPSKILVGKATCDLRVTCVIAPSEGTLEFRCGDAVSEEQATIMVHQPGIVRVGTRLGLCNNYEIHQQRATFPNIEFTEVSSEFYLKLAAQR